MRFHAIGRGIAIMFMALALSIPAKAQTQVYVLDEGTAPFSCSGQPCYGPTVHLINTVTGHDLGSILAAPLGQRGTSMRLSSDGEVLFVTSNSFTDPSAQGRLSIVDALTKTVRAQVTVGAGAADVAILPDSSRAYVVNSTSNSVSVVDLVSFTVIATVTVQSAPARIVVSPDGSAVYVTNRGSGTVSKITTTNNSVAANIAVGAGPKGLDISPDGTRLFVANSDSSTVSVIDATSDSVLRALPVGSADAPPQDVTAQSATRVYVTISDVTSTGSAVLLLNAADGAVIGSSPILPGARLARDSSGTPVFVVEAAFNEPSALKRVAADGASVTVIASGNWIGGAVITDPCAFEATATATVFGPSGGTGTLTIPALAGCAWTIDPSGFAGLSITSPLSGTGPATRAFTVPTSSMARLGAVGIRRQTITLEQTIPRMNVEFASGGPARQQPFTITGWAFDENAFSDGTATPHPGVDQVHVWAYPAGGAPPILVGLATYGASRPDIAAIFGGKYQFSGFSIAVSNLPSGTYTLAFFAHSNRSNTFSNVQTVNVTVQQGGVQIAIDRPAAGVVQTNSGIFFIAGWAVDSSVTTGPGVDAVHVWAYPVSGATPVFLGQATYGGSRPDVAAFLGAVVRELRIRAGRTARAGGLYPGRVRAFDAHRPVRVADGPHHRAVARSGSCSFRLLGGRASALTAQVVTSVWTPHNRSMRTWLLRSHLRDPFAAVLFLFATAAPAAAQHLVYAVETGQNVMCSVSDCHGPVVHVINAATGHDLATIALPGTNSATSLRISSDRRTLFATTTTGSGSPAGRLFVIDAPGRRVAGQVIGGASAVDVAVLPDNSRAYVVDKTGNSVMVVDLSSLTVVATIPVQSTPMRIVVSPTGNALYVANFASSSVSKISTATNTVEATIGVGAGPVGLDLSPDGSRLFVANSGDQTVTVIDATLDSVARVIQTSGGMPFDVSAPSPSRVFLTLNSQTGSGNSFLQLLNATDGAVLGSTQIRPGGLLARDASGTPTYLVETTTSGAIKRVASDATSTTTLATGPNSGSYIWNGAAVATDPCTFEATATPAVFGPAGGTGVLTIPAPAGCSWTIDPNGFPGLSVAAPLSGTGPASRSFTVPSTSIPRLGAIGIGLQALAIEQTIPRMNVEFASGATVQQPFTIGGWALDEHAASNGGPGVDQLHVWAYPAGGAAPLFIGVASHGINRPDVAAVFGSKYQLTGFSIAVSNLPSGSYTIVVFAHSSRSNTFSNAQAVNVSVVRQPAFIAIDTPPAGTVNSGFRVAGWAADPGAAGGGPGIDAVQVWGYPSSGAAPVFAGTAAYGVSRPDVAAYLGPSFQNSGYDLTASLPPGDYTLVVFARSTDTKQFSSQTVRITVQ